jgi:hypothetical protein
MANSFALDTLRQANLSQKIRESRRPVGVEKRLIQKALINVGLFA